MTDTIGWGEVDERPRRLPRVRLNRRRRIVLVVVVALVAGAVLGWPSFRSWRADDAVRRLQHIWARAQGFDNSRITMLDDVQRRIGILDGPAFGQAIAQMDVEEAADLDRLVRQVKGMRTWTSDVAAARTAVAAAISLQAAGLRAQAKQRTTIAFDFLLTASANDRASTAAGTADQKVQALAARHHLKVVTPTTETYHSADAVLHQLRRPTDELLHLRLVSAGSTGVTVTDLDTGRVVVQRAIDNSDAQFWSPQRVLGESVAGTADDGTLIVPLSPSGREHLVAGAYLQSSVGSPAWVFNGLAKKLTAIDELGDQVRGPFRIPSNVTITGLGTGSALLMIDVSTAGDTIPFADAGPSRSRYYLMRPPTGRLTRLAVVGCPQQPSLDGGLVVVPTGPRCDSATELQLFDVSGRLVRTVAIPGGEVLTWAPTSSADGKYVAVTSSRPTGGQVDPQTSLVRLLDVHTWTWTTIANSEGWVPARWSAHGTTLLLQQFDLIGSPGQTSGHIAYLRPGDPTLHSIPAACGHDQLPRLTRS